MDHDDTRALITGGAQGLGLAIAERLIAEGCGRVVLADRNLALAEEAAARLSGDGVSVHAVGVEMGAPESVASMVGAALARMGRVTALVNAAADCGRGSVLDTTPEVWDRIVGVNARGPFFAIQHVAKAAIAAGHPAGIVNIQSVTAHCGLSFLSPYVMSKAALSGLTKNAAHALAGHGIRVNGINVGWMDTPGEDATQRAFHGRSAGWLAAAEAEQPFGQLVKPEEVAWQVALFLSPSSGVVTGTVMDFDQRVIGAYPETGEG